MAHRLRAPGQRGLGRAAAGLPRRQRLRGRRGWAAAAAAAAAPSYYEVLGVGRDAGEKEIKRAYLQKAKEYHPDTSADPDAAAKFQEAQKAYEVLRDAEKRKIYDQIGRERLEQYESTGGAGPGGPGAGGGGGFPGGNPFEGFGGGGGAPDLDDIFSQFFGTGRGGRRGGAADLRLELRLSFQEAAFGCTKDLAYEAPRACGDCGGSGARPGTSRTVCDDCGGSGQQQVRQGLFFMQIPCQSCGATGSVLRSPCGTCRGEGITLQDCKLDVKIPAGVDGGQTLRIRGEGAAGRSGGANGNLILELAVEEDPLFEREGADVTVRVPIGAVQAMLGGDVRVDTLDEGPVSLRVRRGTQHGEKHILRGKGIPRLNGQGRGNQYIVFEVVVPEALSERQRELLQEILELEGEKESDKKAA